MNAQPKKGKQRDWLTIVAIILFILVIVFVILWGSRGSPA